MSTLFTRDKSWAIRAGVVAFLDILSIVFSHLIAVWIRFDLSFSKIPSDLITPHMWLIVFVVIESLILYAAFGLYSSVWRYAGIDEAADAVKAYVVLGPVILVTIKLLNRNLESGLSRGASFMGYLLSFVCCIGIRISYRVIRSYLHSRGRGKHTARVMIIGGGAAGVSLIREYKNSRFLGGRVCCIIDDNPSKIGRKLEGVRIVGDRTTIRENVSKYGIDVICCALPSANVKDRSEILKICQETGCEVKVLPGIYQLVNGEVSLHQLRKVELTDLLGREEISVNTDEIIRNLSGKTVMVTGGGGSIGSELCRQIAHAGPKKLIIFDIYENNVYDVQQELRRKYPDMELLVLIGSVRDRDRLSLIMNEEKPEILFHAAAHKHVPLMEDSPNEAIKNNVFGTWNVAESAAEAGVKTCVLISTDKAVNPTNVMGASKRLCEMIFQYMDRHYSETKYVAVRFGNVLGSNGSVIPLFERQIKEGGPVTVTDPRIIRYFMTIPEAVSLILEASYYAKGGEIFVLDMGDPVKIDDMARTLIRLSGHEPDVDIPIVYTGLRPGEKLYEELLMDEEDMKKTANKRIFIGHPIILDDERFVRDLEELKKAAYRNTEAIREKIEEMVPTFHPENN